MLHGNVKINGYEIMSYQITNEGQLFTETDDSDHTTYNFIVRGMDKGHFPYVYNFTKDVLSKDNHGATTLVAIAMQEAQWRMEQTIYYGKSIPGI